MGRMYSALFEGVSVSAVQDLFELVAPTDAAVVVHRVEISQDGSETSEQLPIRMVRGEGSVTSGSGGSTPTARPLAKGDAAFGGTVEANNTTRMVAGSGALIPLARRAWNVLDRFLFTPTPEERIVISPGDRLTVELPVAPAAALTMSGEIVFEEIGG